ncbi:MAG: dephospho-CoA kinase [Propionibacteriaceae bacterium]|jgi:dephospho-CoA kinase|nr:dephospho-CoA kinase [Propionibacteriaceae bacterium]
MIRVGLTGGIAAGKSVASRAFELRGVEVIDYDILARDVVAVGTDGLAEIVEAFGERVLEADGSLNRSLVAKLVFGDDDEARERLENIIHPRVISEGQLIDIAAEKRGDKLVVHAIPLLVEVAGPEAFDTVIVVDASPEVRVARLVDGRGMDEEEAWGRITAQIDDEVRLAAADFVFDGSGSAENLEAQVNQWMDTVLAKGLHYRGNDERTSFLVGEDL